MSAITVDAATKYFDDTVAVADVSVCAEAGACIALLGHNGAGKTTLVRLLLGLIKPDAGHVAVLDHTAGSATARRSVAYLPESVAFHPLLTGREQLRAFARLKGETDARADALLERVEIDHAADRRVGTYSKGMRQKLGIAQALLGRPGLVLLDEPTSGLDPVARWSFYGMVREATDRGATVVLSSHALTEIEAHTDRIVMLRKGRKVADGDLVQLRSEAALPVRLRVRARDDDASTLQARFGGAKVNGRSIELLCSPDEKMDRIAAVTAAVDLVGDVEVAVPSLDDLYRHFSCMEKEV